jgi:uncharacterized protein (DUF1697 family)
VDTYIALLRGINVGGKNRLPMKDLADLFVDAGCADVETYIQSGNVVFRARATVARAIAPAVEGAIVKRFGLRVPVVTRTAVELSTVARKNPFFASGVEADKLHVAFLAEAPSTSRAAALDPRRSAPDELVVRGRDIYLHLPQGAARTKLTNAYFDSALKTVSTIRNWRTVLALVDRATT